MEHEMTDILFDLKGNFVPAGYPLPLWSEIVKTLPWLKDEVHAGILPLKGAESRDGMLLPQRAKLALRIPEKYETQALALTGKMLDVEGNRLDVGQGRKRPIEAYPTLKAQIVESQLDEAAFLEEVGHALAALGIPCKWICGKRQSLQLASGTVSGYSLVVHDLKPADSIRLQQVGLGKYRHYGCGIFVPHKTIAGLD